MFFQFHLIKIDFNIIFQQTIRAIALIYFEKIYKKSGANAPLLVLKRIWIRVHQPHNVLPYLANQLL